MDIDGYDPDDEEDCDCPECRDSDLEYVPYVTWRFPKAVPTIVKQNHVRGIPRRVRRSMARDLAKRKWKIR